MIQHPAQPTNTSRRIGICSWSLQPETPADLARKVEAVGLAADSSRLPAIQLALDPLRTGAWSSVETLATLQQAGIEIRSGMMAMSGEDYSTLESIERTGGVRADEHWKANLSAAGENARLARELGIGLVTFHAGFLPRQRSDPLRKVMIERLSAVVDLFAGCGVRAAFETGKETAETLLDVLDELDRPSVGVNFDPANMILYGVGDPVAGLRKLALEPPPDARGSVPTAGSVRPPWRTSGSRGAVLQIHIKDAIATTTPGRWGSEVPVGAGEVDWPAFFEVIRESQLTCDLMIERESGANCVADIRRARELIESLVVVGGEHLK